MVHHGNSDSKVPSPAFRLREATLADTPAMAQICMASFAPTPIARGMHGETGQSEAGRASMQTSMDRDLKTSNTGELKYVVAEMMHNPSTTDDSHTDIPSELPQVQTSTRGNYMVGFAKWHFYRASSPPAPASNTVQQEEGGPSLVQAFFGGCHDLRQRYIRRENKPHCILSILAVDPAGQGLGIGAALLRWGTDYAQSERLDCWLTSTPVGYKVYRKAGFADVDVLDVSMKPWGIKKLEDGEDWGQGLAVGMAGVLGDESYRVVLMTKKADES